MRCFKNNVHHLNTSSLKSGSAKLSFASTKSQGGEAGRSNAALKLSLVDHLSVNSLTSQKTDKSAVPARHESTKKASVPLIDKLKDYKLQGMWEPGCRLFAKACKENSFFHRWQKFHVQKLLECLGNTYRWQEIEDVWRVVLHPKHTTRTMIDDGLANLILNITAIRKPGEGTIRPINDTSLTAAKDEHLGIDKTFYIAEEVFSRACESTKLDEKPFFLQVFKEMRKRGLALDYYGSRGFVIGVCRSGMWELAAKVAGICEGVAFNPPAIPSYENLSEDNSSRKEAYEISEIEISEIIRRSESTHVLQQILQARYANESRSNAIPNKILLAAMVVQPNWVSALGILAHNHNTQIDANLINLAVSIAYKGTTNACVVQEVFDFLLNRVTKSSEDGSSTNSLPMFVIARGLTKAYEVIIQAHAREGNWCEALREFYSSQKKNVPSSIDLHGSVLRALNKANRPVDILNSFLAVPNNDVNPTSKKSLLKTLSLINAYTVCKRRRKF